jgi:hypothetical protein
MESRTPMSQVVRQAAEKRVRLHLPEAHAPVDRVPQWARLQPREAPGGFEAVPCGAAHDSEYQRSTVRGSTGRTSIPRVTWGWRRRRWRSS